jgi:hypothetical protein
LKSSSDFIWQLIHSLNSNEKLFFKRNYSGNRSENNRLYIQLFNAIAAQKKYNEEAILKKFHPALNKKNIASQKHYLQRQVCDALVQYDSRDHAGHDIYNQVLLIRVYRKKGLLDEAHAVWKKAMARARKAESYALVNLLKTEFEKMILFSSVHTSNDELYSIFKGHIISYSGYAEMITLRDIYAETVLLKRRGHFDLDKDLSEKIAALSDQIGKTNVSAYGQSFWFRHYYHMSKATLLYLLNDIQGSLNLLKLVMTDWRKNTGFIKTDGEYYIELLYMINYAGILDGAYKFVLDVFNDEINDFIEDPAQRANFEAIKYLALNKIYNKTARYTEVEKLLHFMRAKYRQWEPLINTDLNRTVNLSLGIGCFVLEQFDDALYFTKRAITYFKDGTREEHGAVAQILLLLITYNLNNARLFDAQQKTTYTYFYKRKKKHPFEAALVQCLSRTFYMKDKKNKTEAYQKTLDMLEQSKNDTVQQMAFSIFNYPGWLISRVQRITYREYVARTVKERGFAEVY